MNHVVFNGQTGGLGQYLAAALEEKKITFSPLCSRLEETTRIAGELDASLNALPPHESVTLIPLAGLVPVMVCEKEPDRAFKTNVSDMMALVAQFLEWCDRRNIAARVLYVSSGHVYAPKAARQRLIRKQIRFYRVLFMPGQNYRPKTRCARFLKTTLRI